jgi:acetyl-CoA/propionyl-CoA carboxylase biotin carboxyl carrier protein
MAPSCTSFERECSVQRRFQKIVEETPSPALNADERLRDLRDGRRHRQRGRTTAMPARSSSSTASGEFYFLEMNTRLQVEHPVTEMVTGIDLVASSCASRPARSSAFAQQDIREERGHAIELRIYAESACARLYTHDRQVLALRWPEGGACAWTVGIVRGPARSRRTSTRCWPS